MISVIIPTYNRAYILNKVLPTYLSELVSEIIIIDDGSKDDTQKVIEKFSKEEKKIKYIKHKKRLGAPSARNTGIKNIYKNNKYIFFGEDDVFLIKDCYKIVLDILLKNSLDLLSLNVKYLGEEDKYEFYVSNDITFKFSKTFTDILKMKAIHIGKVEIYNEFKFDKGYIFNSYREETDFYLRVSTKYKIGFIENYLAFNLPRKICNVGGQWSYNLFVYEFSCIYNNIRFFVKNIKKILLLISFKYIILYNIKFILERLRALKTKIFIKFKLSMFI
jgi:glycosyltransferase involved in cell wall biosynthesis